MTEIDIALNTIEVINEYKPKSEPIRPGIMREYDRLSSLEKMKAQAAGFFQKEEVRCYLDAKDTRRADNDSDIHHLLWCAAILEKAHNPGHVVIRHKLAEYDGCLPGIVQCEHPGCFPHPKDLAYSAGVLIPAPLIESEPPPPYWQR